MLLHAAALHQAVATPSWPCTCTKHVPHQHWCRCTAPVPQAVEQYEAIREKEREQLEELEAARRESKAATEAFQAVQQRRYDAFTSAFEHVAAHIDPIYKVGLVAARVVCACVLPVLCMCSTRLRGYVCVCVCVCVLLPACLRPQTSSRLPPLPPGPLLQELTRSSVHPVGGQAYLSLDSSDEPFLHGIKFTAM